MRAASGLPIDFAMDREPTIFSCRELAQRGAWSVADCCPRCHGGTCPEELALEQDVGPAGDEGAVRLHLCCRAAGEMDLRPLASLVPAQGLSA